MFDHGPGMGGFGHGPGMGGFGHDPHMGGFGHGPHMGHFGWGMHGPMFFHHRRYPLFGFGLFGILRFIIGGAIGLGLLILVLRMFMW